VEAKDRRFVEAAFALGRKITAVPADEHRALAAWFDQSSQRLLPKGTWVRFRRGASKGDLGIVVSSSQVDDLATIASIPRMPSPSTSPMPLQSSKGGKTGARLSGLRLQELQAAHALVEEPRPELDQVLLFRESGWGVVAPSVADALRRGSIRKAWRPGDQVAFVNGELTGFSGRLESLDLELWSATICMLDTPGLSSQQASLDDLVRRIPMGANVAVVAGKSKERRGVVVSSDHEHTTFIEDKTREEVSLIFTTCCTQLKATTRSPCFRCWSDHMSQTLYRPVSPPRLSLQPHPSTSLLRTLQWVTAFF
jgi:transcription elongation factor